MTRATKRQYLEVEPILRSFIFSFNTLYAAISFITVIFLIYYAYMCWKSYRKNKPDTFIASRQCVAVYAYDCHPPRECLWCVLDASAGEPCRARRYVTNVMVCRRCGRMYVSELLCDQHFTSRGKGRGSRVDRCDLTQQRQPLVVLYSYHCLPRPDEAITFIKASDHIKYYLRRAGTCSCEADDFEHLRAIVQLSLAQNDGRSQLRARLKCGGSM